MTFFVVLVLTALGQTQEPPVEGDLSLLSILKDAQTANSTKYTHGEMKCLLESGPSRNQIARKIEVRLRWKDDQIRCWSKATSLVTKALSNSELTDSDAEIDSIHDSQKIMQYFSRSMVLRIDPVSVVGPYPDTVSLLPNRWWYGRGRPWLELLGPHSNFPQQNVIRYVVKKLDDDRIEVLREDQKGGTVRIISSLRDDGNVIENSSSHPAIRQVKKETYTWSRDSKGRCYLLESESEIQALRQSSPSPINHFNRYKTLYFDSDYVPDPSLFEMKSLEPKNGTRVDDKIENRTKRIGERSVISVIDRLDPLIDEMKARGFAKPDR